MRSILFPASCIICLRQLQPYQRTLCRRCLELLQQELILQQTADGHVFLFKYANTVRTVLKTAKTRPSFHALQTLLSIIDASLVLQTGAATTTAEIITPIPTKFSSLLHREFSPAHSFALLVAKTQKLPIRNCLAFMRRIGKQSMLIRTKRFANMVNSLRTTSLVQGRHILLVDDIMTTGATISAAKEALFTAGATSVSSISIAASVVH